MLRARVFTALVLVAALLAVLFALSPAAAAAAFGVVAVLAAWEWAGLMRIDAAARVMYGAVTALFCWQVYVAGEPAFLTFWAAAALFWLLPAGLWLRWRWSLAGNDFLGYALGLVLIVATWAAMVALHRRGAWVLIAVMAVAWVSDSAAYFVGRAWGRRKLAPAISPGKTWEGVGGAMVGVLVYGFALAAATGQLASFAAALALLALLPLLTALGIIGDLFESLLKRQAGLKDSSRLLPGHGGILDRIDSLLAILPVAALLPYGSRL